MNLLLNCDLGEEIVINGVTSEELVMPHIDMANIACGGHAGDDSTMIHSLILAKQHDVVVGAHPGYADKSHFGRLSIPHNRHELEALLNGQISRLHLLATDIGVPLRYVKPHGALYNDMMEDDALLRSLLAILATQPIKCLVMLATAQSDRHREMAAKFGIEIMFESFADRCYGDDGKLLPRSEANAIHSRDKMLAQVEELCHNGTVTTAGGKTLRLNANTLCVHGDSQNSVAAIYDIRQIISGKP